MRSLKTRGGLTRGKGMTENVILTWVHTIHTCAQGHNAMTQLTGNHHKTSNQHAELGASRIKRLSDDLEKIKLWIENHNPFDDNKPLLRSIATGLTARKEVVSTVTKQKRLVKLFKINWTAFQLQKQQ